MGFITVTEQHIRERKLKRLQERTDNGLHA
jgi:hypothetical protein